MRRSSASILATIPAADSLSASRLTTTPSLTPLGDHLASPRNPVVCLLCEVSWSTSSRATPRGAMEPCFLAPRALARRCRSLLARSASWRKVLAPLGVSLRVADRLTSSSLVSASIRFRFASTSSSIFCSRRALGRTRTALRSPRASGETLPRCRLTDSLDLALVAAPSPPICFPTLSASLTSVKMASHAPSTEPSASSSWKLRSTSAASRGTGSSPLVAAGRAGRISWYLMTSLATWWMPARTASTSDLTPSMCRACWFTRISAAAMASSSRACSRSSPALALYGSSSFPTVRSSSSRFSLASSPRRAVTLCSARRRSSCSDSCSRLPPLSLRATCVAKVAASPGLSSRPKANSSLDSSWSFSSRRVEGEPPKSASCWGEGGASAGSWPVTSVAILTLLTAVLDCNAWFCGLAASLLRAFISDMEASRTPSRRCSAARKPLHVRCCWAASLRCTFSIFSFSSYRSSRLCRSSLTWARLSSTCCSVSLISCGSTLGLVLVAW
mmetsp:Transcript_13262/g.31379  ORF Transcript_13262/g.31379 Transcript_13262/m.31379 type:complete len:502 (+) Transcript_13262:194-1699(+)